MNDTSHTRTLHDMGQSIWLDDISRELLDSGALQRHVDRFSVTGLTSDPTIFEQALRNSSAYDDDIRERERAGRRGEDLLFDLAIDDLSRAADMFRPIYERTDHLDGWVSLEVPPTLSDDTDSTLRIATELFARAGKPNLLIKIPATPEGLVAIEHATFAGIPVNATLLFSREQYLLAANAWLKGIERRIVANLDPDVRSVASVFVGSWDAAVENQVPPERRNQLGIAMANRTYAASRSVHASHRWQRAMNAGARPQRVLWAGTGTKDPAAPDTLYVGSLVAPYTVNALPAKTLLAFADHGTFGALLGHDLEAAEATIDFHVRSGIDLVSLSAKLQEDGVFAFTKSWHDTLECISRKSGSAIPPR